MKHNPDVLKPPFHDVSNPFQKIWTGFVHIRKYGRKFVMPADNFIVESGGFGGCKQWRLYQSVLDFCGDFAKLTCIYQRKDLELLKVLWAIWLGKNMHLAHQLVCVRYERDVKLYRVGNLARREHRNGRPHPSQRRPSGRC